MSIYDATIEPPQTFEAVDRIVDALRVDAALEQGMGGAGRIYRHVSPGAKPERYIVVREPVMPGGSPEHFERTRPVRVQVLAECAESLDNREWWLSAIHQQVYKVLTGRHLSLTRSDQLTPIRRTHYPSPPAYDANDHAFYSSAEYELTLAPKIES